MTGSRTDLQAQQCPRGGARANATRFRRASLLVLVLLAFGLYMWRIDAKGIWWDESLSLYRAQQTVPYILSGRIDFPGFTSIDQHPPLYFLLLHGVVRLCGESDLALRFPSVFFAILIVPLLYTMGVRLRGAITGLVAALFGALSPFYLWYAQEARMYTMLTALGLGSTWFLWRAFTEEKWTWRLASGLLTLLGVATQYLYALLIPCQLLLAFFLWPRRSTLGAAGGHPRLGRRYWVALACAAAIPLLVLPVVVCRVTALVPTLRVGRRYVSPVVMLCDALNSFSLGLSVSLHKIWWLDLFFAAVFVVGILSVWRRPPHLDGGTTQSRRGDPRGVGLAVLLAYIFVPMVCIWVFSLFVPMYANSRYLIMSSPAFYLGLALGVQAAARWKRGFAVLLAAVLVTSMGASTRSYFFKERYQAKEDYRSAAQLIMANERTRDAIIVSGPESMTAFMHYYQGSLPVIDSPRSGRDPSRIAGDLANLARSHDRLWHVHGRTLVSDPDNLVEQWIGTHTVFLGRKTFPGYAGRVSVSTHLPQHPVQTTEEGDLLAEPVGSFGGHLALLDYAVHYANVAGEAKETAYSQATRVQGSLPIADGVEPGKVVSVAFVWRPLREMGVYKTSLRLVDHQGLIWAQRDREPFMYLPTNEWPVGARILHETDVRIPPGTPPGDYALQLWVYEKATGQPLSFSEPSPAQDGPWLELGQVVVALGQHDWPEDAFLPEGVHRPRLTAVFGGCLELMAHSVAPQAVRPGGTLDLQLYWRARRPPGEDYDLVVNWVDPAGKVWHTATHNPAGKAYPTSRWRKGEMVRGLLRLSVPPDTPQGVHKIHLLVSERTSKRLLWLGRGWLPWTGRDLEIARLTVQG